MTDRGWTSVTDAVTNKSHIDKNRGISSYSIMPMKCTRSVIPSWDASFLRFSSSGPPPIKRR